MPAIRREGWVVRCGGVPDCGFRLLLGPDDPLKVHAASALHGHLCPDMHPTDIRALAMEDPESRVHELR